MHSSGTLKYFDAKLGGKQGDDVLTQSLYTIYVQIKHDIVSYNCIEPLTNLQWHKLKSKCLMYYYSHFINEETGATRRSVPQNIPG